MFYFSVFCALLIASLLVFSDRWLDLAVPMCWESIASIVICMPWYPQALRFEVSVKFSALAPLTCLGRHGRLSRLSHYSLYVKHGKAYAFATISTHIQGDQACNSRKRRRNSCSDLSNLSIEELRLLHRYACVVSRLPTSPVQLALLCFVLLVRACDQPINYIRYVCMFICVDFVGFHTCCHDVFPS